MALSRARMQRAIPIGQYPGLPRFDRNLALLDRALRRFKDTATDFLGASVVRLCEPHEAADADGALALVLGSRHGSVSVTLPQGSLPALDLLAKADRAIDKNRIARIVLASRLRAPAGPAAHAESLQASAWDVRDVAVRAAEATLASAPATGGARPLVIDFALGRDVHRVGVLAIDASLADALERASASCHRTQAASLPALRCRTDLEIGCLKLRRSQVGTLRAGDVLLSAELGRCRATLGTLNAASDATLSWGASGHVSYMARGAVNDALFTTFHTTIMPPESAISSRPTFPGAAPPRPLSIDDVELQVRIVIDGPVLSLADIAGLSAGSVLSMETPLSTQSLRITVQGQTIAYGGLVAVGDQLGVQIERTADGHGHHQ